MDETQKLLDALKDDDAETRNRATRTLWRMWFGEAGPEAETTLNRGTAMMNAKRLEEAESVFLHLIQQHPDFPEAHNKLATVLFLKGDYTGSVVECQRTLRMNPHHFGAWNGMGLCLYQLARYDEALKSFHRALSIQPHADINRKYIARCRGHLN